MLIPYIVKKWVSILGKKVKLTESENDNMV
jgi:hypothetical protein